MDPATIGTIAAIGTVASTISKVNRAIQDTGKTIQTFSNNQSVDRRPKGGMLSGQQGHRVPPHIYY